MHFRVVVVIVVDAFMSEQIIAGRRKVGVVMRC